MDRKWNEEDLWHKETIKSSAIVSPSMIGAGSGDISQDWNVLYNSKTGN